MLRMVGKTSTRAAFSDCVASEIHDGTYKPSRFGRAVNKGHTLSIDSSVGEDLSELDEFASVCHGLLSY